MIRGVIFDLGGTLMHLDGKCREVDRVATRALVEFLQAHGVSVGEEFAAALIAARQRGWQLAEQTELEQEMERALCTALGWPASRRTEELVSRAVDAYMRARAGFWVSNPRAVDVLEELRAGGLLLGAVTNTEHDGLMRQSAARLGFSSYLRPLVTSARAKWRKPNPYMFDQIAGEWGLEPDEIVVVGDVPWEDIAGAHRAGMRAILVERDTTWRAGLPRNRPYDTIAIPDATVQSLAELFAVMAQMQDGAYLPSLLADQRDCRMPMAVSLSS